MTVVSLQEQLLSFLSPSSELPTIERTGVVLAIMPTVCPYPNLSRHSSRVIIATESY